MTYGLQKSERGVTLLLTVLILAASLSVALGIFYIVFIQLQISRGAKESYIALYSAYTGEECALYYRYRYPNVNPESGPDSGGFWSPDKACDGNVPCRVQCGGTPDTPPILVSVQPLAGGLQGNTYTFDIDKNDICTTVNVRVEKKVSGGVPFIETLVDAKGKNSCASTNFLVNRTIQYCDNPLEDPCTQL